MQRGKKKLPQFFILFLFITFLFLPTYVMAAGAWWKVTPEPENPSKEYDSIYYSQIGPKLREIELNSNRVKVEVIGQSAEGRNLFLATVSDPQAMGRLGQYQAIRNTMIKDPEKAQAMIDKLGDFKVPVFINGSIHGGEYPGTDAAIRLIETLAYQDTEEVQKILKNVILLVNVVQNPDGRVMGTRSNSAGVDLNRDFITQTQPETRATVKLITAWNPMVFLDLHGFINPMLIEPCTPPHNPNYEYDLYIQWAFDQAEAMEKELFDQTGFSALIPFRDWENGWDDWPPIYTPMYAMYHGSYGHTLETPYEDELGVDAHYAAVWGALKFVAENKAAMLNDQIEIFRRGYLDLPQEQIPFKILERTPYDQYNDLIVKEFPAAYVIPADGSTQLSDHQPARLVDFLLFNDVQVEKASQSFKIKGVNYPKGSYVVWMDQPKRSLANAILEDGMDVSFIEALPFYSAPTAWSHPLLWGVTRDVIEEDQDIKTRVVNKADAPKGSVAKGKGNFYAYQPTSLAAFKATNSLLKQGVTVYRAKSSGMFMVPANSSIANELANSWALDVFPLKNLPDDAVLMEKQRIAVYGDAGVAICLNELGFEYDQLSTSDLNAGAIAGYDVFINQYQEWSGLDVAGKAAFSAYFAAGGDYIGLQQAWTYFAGGRFAKDAGIIDFDFDINWDADAILKIVYEPGDTIAAGFRNNGYGYAYNAVWFTDYEEGAQVSASFAEGDFLVAGYWPEWQSSDAKGEPVVIHRESGEKGVQDTALIGIDATFRGHPKNTFRLVGNAIFSSLD